MKMGERPAQGNIFLESKMKERVDLFVDSDRDGKRSRAHWMVDRKIRSDRRGNVAVALWASPNQFLHSSQNLDYSCPNFQKTIWDLLRIY